MIHTFDAIVIGAGQAGPALAGRLTDAGMRVALVERKSFGGTCVNTGCTPTKTLIASAYAAYLARRGGDYGVSLASAVSVDMEKVKVRQDTVVRTTREGLEAWLKTLRNCTLYRGHAKFESGKQVRVGDESLTAERIFINVGGRANVPRLPGLDQIHCLTNSSLLELRSLPRHLVVIGGSYVGLEFAQMYRRFGSEVTVVEMADRLIRREDPEVSDCIREILEAEGIQIRLGAECVRFEASGPDVRAHVVCRAGEPDILGSHVLLAVGRRPNTDDLGLEAAGVQLDKRGYIIVDDELRTSVPGIWAMGDCNGKGKGAFTHTAYNDFEIVAANLLEQGKRRVSDRIPTYALFTDPPLGRAGLSEAEARAAGKKPLVAFRPMTQVRRAIEKGETRGFMKIVVDAQSQLILGAAILGTSGDETIHQILDIMYARAPYPTLQHAVHIHPTVSELIPTMLGELKSPGLT